MEGVAAGGIAGDISGGAEAKHSSTSSTPSPTPSPPLPTAAFYHAGAHGMEAATEAPGMATGMMGGVVGADPGDLFRGKKRGRPKKFGPDGMAPALTLPASAFSSDGKRSKGRPPGSGKHQLLAALGEWFACSAGGNFTPHVVTISAGEDAAARILSFSQKGPRSICILSANGAISNVTLRQPGSSGGTLTYEVIEPKTSFIFHLNLNLARAHEQGRFEILSLSGSFTLTANGGGVRSRTGGISVSLAGPDGRVIGGGVAGSLLAASPIQVVVGSFTPNTFSKDQKPKPAPLQTPPAMPARPISQASPQDDCEMSTSSAALPVEPPYGSTADPSTPDPALRAASWHGLQSSEHDPSPDINVRLHGEY
ncbi:AT-hook motif nuclear-localized protein 1-like isoform X1 [Zingiber officinale]|uniref:AT-hook motif nuclear-localized protein 1-like isoform X1 n=1 Tax=Zingiber officinale TaxID=94328 RepID=UPI001C4B9BC1|nr:AT-hook motif nuclear-localized protein 1-like isoform X1 [Zingiber officinale]